MRKPQKKLIAELGEPVLHKKAKPIENINDPKIQELIDDMVITMQEANGIGLAAPQVYESLRLFLINSYKDRDNPDIPETKLRVVINPMIIEVSEETEKGWEGCLSIPKLAGKVSRHTSIKVEYTNRVGKKVKETLENLGARVFQHEHDHIEGILFLDRVKNSKDLATDTAIERRIAERDRKRKNEDKEKK